MELNWEVLGAQSDFYAIKYGLERDSLPGMIVTTGTNALLSGLTYGREYFFQIYATTADQRPQGLPSEIFAYTMPIAEGKAPEADLLT